MYATHANQRRKLLLELLLRWVKVKPIQYDKDNNKISSSCMQSHTKYATYFLLLWTLPAHVFLLFGNIKTSLFSIFLVSFLKEMFLIIFISLRHQQCCCFDLGWKFPQPFTNLCLSSAYTAYGVHGVYGVWVTQKRKNCYVNKAEKTAAGNHTSKQARKYTDTHMYKCVCKRP